LPCQAYQDNKETHLSVPAMPAKSIALSTLRMLAAKLSLNLVGSCDLSLLLEDAEHLKSWQSNGFAAEMKFMQGPSASFVSTDHILKETRSVLSCSLNYSSAPHPPCPPCFGRVARYAWGRDYHIVLRERLTQLVRLIEDHLETTFKVRVFTDALPFLERAAAKSAGLGFVGKNTLLIRKGLGSYFFLGEIFSELEIINDVKFIVNNDNTGCGSCTRCINSCPTNALVADKVLDARKCISYLTIEKRGVLPEHELAMLGEWVFGCDICQDVCPFNHAALKTGRLPVVSDFATPQGTGPLLDLKQVLSIRTNKDFDTLFATSPVSRARRVGLQRNAIAVAVNTKSNTLRNTIEDLWRVTESDVLKQTAEWALALMV